MELETARRRALVGEMLRGAAIARSQRELLDGITGILARALDTDLAGAFEFLPDEGRAVLQAGVGWGRGLISEAEVPAGEDSAARDVLASGRTLSFDGSPDPNSEPGGRASELLAGRSCSSACATRIEGPERPWGYLISGSLAEREFDSSDIETLEAAAATISLALGRLRAERRFTAQRGLIEIVADARSLREASSQILELIGTGIGWQVATLWLVDEAANRIRCVDAWSAAGADDEFVKASLRMDHGRGEGIPGEAWASAKPRWISSAPDEPRFKRASIARKAGLQTGLIFPIVSRGRVAGVFEIFTRVIEQPDEPLVADLAVFGTQIGLLLEREHREEYLRESEEAHRRIGEVLQLGLLPPALPDLTPVDLAVRFRAMGDRALIGGDFYDAFPLPGDRWMIVVGDIAGKGVEAAAFTALVRYTIRAIAVRDRDPGAALAQLNEMLITDPAEPRLCTAVCALLEPGSARVTIARGGHPPPLLLPADSQQPVRIQPRGEILGAFADANFETESFSLDTGDTLVMYTDGVSEAGAHNDAGMIEIEGIESYLRETRDGDADSIAGAIDAAAAAADRGDQRDDALVVAIKAR